MAINTPLDTKSFSALKRWNTAGSVLLFSLFPLCLETVAPTTLNNSAIH